MPVHPILSCLQDHSPELVLSENGIELSSIFTLTKRKCEYCYCSYVADDLDIDDIQISIRLKLKAPMEGKYAAEYIEALSELLKVNGVIFYAADKLTLVMATEILEETIDHCEADHEKAEWIEDLQHEFVTILLAASQMVRLCTRFFRNCRSSSRKIKASDLAAMTACAELGYPTEH